MSSVSSLAQAVSQSTTNSIGERATVYALKKAQEQQAQQALALVQGIPSVQNPSNLQNNTSLGRLLDVKV